MNKLVFGVRGQGKTTLAYDIAKKSKRPLAVYDISHRFNAWPELIVRDAAEVDEAIDACDEVIYQPQADEWAEFGSFSEAIWDRQLTLLIDEASSLQGPQHAHEWLNKWIRFHPVDEVDVIQTMHAPADSWARCRSLAEDWYIFRTWRPADLKAIAEQCGDETAMAVEKLEPYHYLHFNAPSNTREVSGDARQWYHDLKGHAAEIQGVASYGRG